MTSEKQPVPAIPEDIMDAAREAVRDPAGGAILCIAKAILAEREKAALLVEQTDLGNNKTHMLARIAIKIAARAIRRGRHLTTAEKLQNVQNWLAEENA